MEEFPFWDASKTSSDTYRRIKLGVATDRHAAPAKAC